jgi:predicted nucleic acid-binding protein
MRPHHDDRCRQPQLAHPGVTAAVIAAGRKPRGRVVDLMIAATTIAEGLPLYTTNPADFTGLDSLARIIPVTRPPVPHEGPSS